MNTYDDEAKNIAQDLNTMFDAFTWLADNINKLPLVTQLKFLEETMRYAHAITPLYITSFYLYGDKKEGKEND